MNVIAALWKVLPRQRRWFWLVLLLMLASAVAELFTIAAVVPFLTLLSGAGSLSGPRVYGLPWPETGSVIAAGLLLVAAALTSAVMRLALSWYSQRFALKVGQELANQIFSHALRQPYVEHLRKNSSDILAGVEKVQNVTFGIINPVMQGSIAGVTALFIIVYLINMSAAPVILATLVLVMLYGIINAAMHGRLGRNSSILAVTGRARIKIVREALEAIRDIILDRSQPYFEARFQQLDAAYRGAQASTSFVAMAPRYVVEAGAVAVLVMVALTFSAGLGGDAPAIPMLGALALAGQRLLPLVQQVFSGWTHLSGNLQPLFDVIALASAPLAPDEAGGTASPVPLRQEIALDGVVHRHESSAFTLQDITLNIPRGYRLGVTGPTGSGKSTMLDLLMGLLEPSSGTISIDGRPLTAQSRQGWQTQIAHVPQSIYLSDDTIAANIAFGIASDRVSMERVRAAAAAAQIDDVIEELPLGYQTIVGERGIRLSGGQRQRLGIARALYKRAPVLILDEATNALDEETEARVMRAIYASDVTMIVVAHRPATLELCDEIVRLEGGRLVPFRRWSAPGVGARMPER